jgi:glycosyltransferase involved in cell wall biosynthesis
VSLPAITVAIPFRDEENHLESAIRSILRQTHTDFELLLVDDGSTDASLTIARSFTDPRIVVFSDGRSRGLPARLNEIAKRARGSLVARMDADDLVHPTRLERQLAYSNAHPSCSVVGTWIGMFDHDERVIGVGEAVSLPPSAEDALLRGIMAHAAIVARRTWLLENPYDEALTRTEDRDLWVRTAKRTEFGVVPEPLYAVRIDTRDPRFLEKYVTSQRQSRTIAWRHGPSTIGLTGTARFALAAHAKTAVMRIAHAAGLSPTLVRRRGRPPTAFELSLIQEALESGRQRL